MIDQVESSSQDSDHVDARDDEGYTRTIRNEIQLGRRSIIVSVLAAVTAVGAITTELLDFDAAAYILKPTTIILIIAVAGFSYGLAPRSYKRFVIAGLMFSLAGDVLLMIPADLFIFGLAAFLVAQILYTAAFVSIGGFFRSLTAAIPLVIFGLIMGLILSPQLGDLQLPTFAYMAVILVMAWQALGQWQQTKGVRALLAFVGALLFVASDTLLAINRFASSLTFGPLLVLGTYYPAQWLIAISSGEKHR